jgi:predicted HicB family RNase H-like nuclease
LKKKAQDTASQISKALGNITHAMAHRTLATEAAEQGVSINRLVTAKLAL